MSGEFRTNMNLLVRPRNDAVAQERLTRTALPYGPVDAYERPRELPPAAALAPPEVSISSAWYTFSTRVVNNMIAPKWERASTTSSRLAYEAFGRLKNKAGETYSLAARQKAIDYANQHLGPTFHIAEVALQYLAQELAYMYLPDGQSVKLSINTNLERETVNWFAQSYRVKSSIVDREHELTAFLLTPERDALKLASIVLFRGTCAGSDRDMRVALEGHPMGILTDLDAEGVGAGGMQHNLRGLREWVVAEVGKGRRVYITGHSLGAAQATRLCAGLADVLTGAQKKMIHLALFSPPAVEEGVADAVVASPDRTTMVWHARDAVCMAGRKHVSGRGYQISNTINPNNAILEAHSKPFLVRWAAAGEALHCLRQPAIAKPIFLKLGEGVRLGAGHLAGRLLARQLPGIPGDAHRWAER